MDPLAHPFGSGGVGADNAERVLAEFLLKRGERRLDLVEGCGVGEIERPGGRLPIRAQRRIAAGSRPPGRGPS
jgi:hypothetical protein